MQLFMTKQELLWEWCKKKIEFSTVDVEKYGVENYNIRAARTIRSWAADGKLIRIEDNEKYRRGLVKSGNKNIGWWRVNEDQEKD